MIGRMVIKMYDMGETVEFQQSDGTILRIHRDPNAMYVQVHQHLQKGANAHDTLHLLPEGIEWLLKELAKKQQGTGTEITPSFGPTFSAEEKSSTTDFSKCPPGSSKKE